MDANLRKDKGTSIPLIRLENADQLKAKGEQ